MGLKTFTHSSTSHSQEMLDKLNALRNEGHLCDVTIRVQDKLFLAHKVVLACCSEFFRSKLVGRAEEEDKFVLDLHHVTVSGFAPLLEYAYTSTLSISTENIIDVLAAASYMQMFAVASTCSEFMKSSILWSPGNSNNSLVTADKPHEAAQESTSSNCALTPLDGSVSPVSSDCSVMERNVPVCRESRRKRKSFVTMASPESPLKCTTQMVTTSPQIPNPSPSFSDSTAQPVESSLAFPWTFPFGIDRRFHSDKSKLPESPRCLEQGTSGTSDVVVSRRLSDFLTCESSKAVSSPVPAEEEDVRVKVERLSDEEVQEASSQPVSASQSSLSDQQTVPGSEQVQEELLISPQSSSIGGVFLLALPWPTAFTVELLLHVWGCCKVQILYHKSRATSKDTVKHRYWHHCVIVSCIRHCYNRGRLLTQLTQCCFVKCAIKPASPCPQSSLLSYMNFICIGLSGKYYFPVAQMMLEKLSCPAMNKRKMETPVNFPDLLKSTAYFVSSSISP